MEPFLLSSSLELVAAQRLVRILCPYCKLPYQPEQNMVAKIINEGHFSPKDVSTWTFYKSVGCPRCVGTGYLGRRAIYEVFRIGEKLRNIIYKSQDLIEMRRIMRESGELNLRASGWRKVVKGLTTIEEIMAITTEE